MIGYLTQNHPLVEAFAAGRAGQTVRTTAAAQRLFRGASRLSVVVPAAEMGDYRGELDRPIAGLASDVRRVVPGSVFFALEGENCEGRRFIDEAVRRGAVAVVTQRLPVLRPGRTTWIEVADVRATLAAAAQRFYGFPDRRMTLVGVAGGNGRTAAAHLLQHLLQSQRDGGRVGLLGAVHYDLGARTVPAGRAEPGDLEIFGLLAQMRAAGCRQAVLEVVPDAAAGRSLPALQWGAAVFSELGENTGNGSRILAAGRLPALTVVNLDDAGGRGLAAALRAKKAATRLVTCGENPAALVRAEAVTLRSEGTNLRIVWPGGRLEVESPLLGRAHVGSLLAAVAAAWGLGCDPRVVLARLGTFRGVPGRLQRVAGGGGFAVVVDGARTSEALRHALGELRPITSGRLLVAFGCGCEHDRAERERMTRVAQAGSDFAVATADNPRAEDMRRVFAQMSAGVSAPERLAWVADRRRAIALALAMARPGDAVLLAGKGHDGAQELGGTVFPFDDRVVVRELLATAPGEGEG